MHRVSVDHSVAQTTANGPACANLNRLRDEWVTFTQRNFAQHTLHESLPLLPACMPSAIQLVEPAGVITTTDFRAGTKYAFVWLASLQHLAEAFCILEDMKLVRWCLASLQREQRDPILERKEWLLDYWQYVSMAIIAYSRCFDESVNGISKLLIVFSLMLHLAVMANIKASIKDSSSPGVFMHYRLAKQDCFSEQADLTAHERVINVYRACVAHASAIGMCIPVVRSAAGEKIVMFCDLQQETTIDISAIDALASKVMAWLCSENGIPRLREAARVQLEGMDQSQMHVLPDFEAAHLMSMDAAWKIYCNEQCGRNVVPAVELMDAADDLGFGMFGE